MAKRKRDVREELTGLMATWDLKTDQMLADGHVTPGIESEIRRAIYGYVGDALRIVARKTDEWTRRCDDAKRIPEVIRECADFVSGPCREASCFSAAPETGDDQ